MQKYSTCHVQLLSKLKSKKTFDPNAEGLQPMNVGKNRRQSVIAGIRRVARFSTTKYGRFLSVDPSKSSPPNVSIYNFVHVDIRIQIPHKQ